ncbi:hypothetical protein RJ639_040981 [Escallonia herrerae]|uniref:Tetratricopeptide repeat-like superfamily protein n=1 Tax=Escallonia herrerae TaxID=1293975 RepID=A0AA89B564_9ASTE|nr:hypothetical protein RJ639_040981 [Escallonia herrerae]
MGVKVATTPCFNWFQTSVPHSPSFSQTLNSAISSPSSKRRCISDRALVCRYVHGFGSSKPYRSRSCEFPKSRGETIKRACSASLDAFSDEEFSKKIQELALRFQWADDDTDEESKSELIEAQTEILAIETQSEASQRPVLSSKLEPVEPPEWPGEIIPASIERKANSVDLPLSLRIIKRKKQWQEGFREVGEFAYCSVKKAFSSMVFIIRELQSYTLQMREILFYEDLQDILVRVQREMNASFVWLFQQVFSHTPTLMVYVMILLANYSVHSMSSHAAIAATTLPQAYAAATESVSIVDDKLHKFDSSTMKTFLVSSSGGKAASIGGQNGGGGGGGKLPVVGSGTEGDGRFDGSFSLTIIPDGVSSIGNPTRTSEDESVSGQVIREEEVGLWNSIVEQASSMQEETREEALDHETMQRFVSPVNVRIEEEDYADYFRTELLYQTGLIHEPNNPLLLANYAQFLYLVAHDYDRADEYFKRAAKVEPKDAEALSKYASFLWQAKKDLWAAEETYLEAISVDPSNSYYAANYAHFLWSTGGEDTCYPLNSPDTIDD